MIAPVPKIENRRSEPSKVLYWLAGVFTLAALVAALIGRSNTTWHDTETVSSGTVIIPAVLVGTLKEVSVSDGAYQVLVEAITNPVGLTSPVAFSLPEAPMNWDSTDGIETIIGKAVEVYFTGSLDNAQAHAWRMVEVTPRSVQHD
jgi:hypothetical protein